MSDCWPVHLTPRSAVRTVLLSSVLTQHLAFMKYASNILRWRYSPIFSNNLKEGSQHQILTLFIRFFVLSEER